MSNLHSASTLSEPQREQRHTPGPWTMETVRTSCGVCFKVGPFPWKNGQQNHACIYADYPGSGPEYRELVANARLIAAAPELLKALQRLMKHAKKDLAFATEEYLLEVANNNAVSAEMREVAAGFLAARDAIAKATGAA